MATPEQQILPKPPPTLPPWAKVLYYLLDTAITGATYLAYQYATQINPAGGSVEDPTAGEWRRFVYRVADNASQDTADDQYMSWDVANITGGELDSTWNTTDHETVAASLNNIVTAVMSYVPAHYAAVEVKAYARVYQPYNFQLPLEEQLKETFVDSGPPVWIDTFNVAGSATGTVGPQVCTTVTEETAARRHWGRVYLPTIGSSAIEGTTGRLQAAPMQAILDAFELAYFTLQNSQYPIVVPTVQANKTASRVLQTVSGVRIDNTLDVIRRRRHKHPTVTLRAPLA